MKTRLTLYILIGLTAGMTPLSLEAGPPNKPSRMVRKFDDCLPFFAAIMTSDVKGRKYYSVFNSDRSFETEFTKPKGLINYFRSQPAARQKLGIIIWDSLTHLKDPKSSKSQLSDYMKGLFADPKWLEGQRRFLSQLVDACKKESIDLWINTGLGKKPVEFINLTSMP